MGKCCTWSIWWATVIQSKDKWGGERPPSSSFLNRDHPSIISNFSRLGRGIFLALQGQARAVMAQWKSSSRSQYSESLCFEMSPFHSYCVCVCVCTEHVQGVINSAELTGQDVGLMPPSLLSGGMSRASAARALCQVTCLVLWLSNH